MKTYDIDLTELVDPPSTDSISGREFGEQHAKDTAIFEHLHQGETIRIFIDSDLVKAINDSFIKGFFSKIFEEYKKVSEVKKYVELHCSEDFQRLFEKNWSILEAINNA